MSLQAFEIVAGCALGVHLLFKRYEFDEPIPLLLLLGVVPGLLTNALVPHFSHTSSAVLVTFLTYFITLLLSIGVYRVSPFHPLAKYPGPVLGKLSKLWMTYVTWTGKRHNYILDFHCKYGDVVRTGPNELYIRDATAILPLMGTTGWTKSSHWIGRTLKTPNPPLIAIRDPLKHMRRRKTWARGFSIAALKGYEPIVSKRVDQLVQHLLNQKGVVDLAESIGYFAFDVMTDMAFGGGKEMLQDGDKTGFWHLIEGSMRAATMLGNIPWFVQFAKCIPGVGEDLKAFRAFGISQATIRRDAGSKYKDLFYYLADEEGVEKKPVPFSEFVSDGALVIAAGSDTTATVLSSLFYYLLENPAKYTRLQTEVDKFYPPDETPTLEHLSDMPYLEACINEALRLSPPVITGSERSAYQFDSSKGKMMGSYYIPEGTNATINTYAVQRDPRNFYPQPDSLLPERWLIAQGLEKAPADFVHDTTAFIPFSFGPTNCVGKPLAMLELRSTTLNIVHSVQMALAKGYEKTWEADMQDFFVVQKGKLPVVCTARAGNN